MSNSPKPVVLVILDGWGVAPATVGNAVAAAETPNFRRYTQMYKTLILQASGEAVGLPFGGPGNSEVGHTNLGAGRIVYQTLPRITQSIWAGNFFSNPVFLGACEHVQRYRSALHLMGLVSSGGVHSYIEHLSALIELAKREKVLALYLHIFLDGRDTEYNSGINFVTQLQEGLATLGLGRIATISGRFYALDRDEHWERIEMAYKALVKGEAEKRTTDPMQAVKDSYQNGVYDEEFIPTVITDDRGKPVGLIRDNDTIIFFNFRGDRARELTKAFVEADFRGFRRTVLKNIFFVTMTEYEKGLPVRVAFPPEMISNPLPKILSDAGMKQLHIAETEKYAHVTFFFNCGREAPFPGQDNILVPSPRIPSYALKPEMSAHEVTNKLTQAIKLSRYNFILVNYANADMVGHTGVFEAGIKAVEKIDKCLGQVVDLVISQGGVALLTADHGNAEEMIDLQTGEIDKEHSNNPVPCIIVGKDFISSSARSKAPDLSTMTPAGILADVAPTILKIMGLEKPKEMNGHVLI